MTEPEHAELLHDEDAGRLMIGIDRPTARKFFTDLSITSIEAETGESPYLEKMVVLACFIGGPLALLAAMLFSLAYFRWWSVAVIPAIAFLWIAYYAASSVGGAGVKSITITLLAAIAVHIFNPFEWPFTHSGSAVFYTPPQLFFSEHLSYAIAELSTCLQTQSRLGGPTIRIIIPGLWEGLA